MLAARPFEIDGEDWGTTYVFNKGDEFPVHVHPTENENHISILMFGAIKLTGHPDYEGVVARAQAGGLVINWEPGKPHGWTALEDGTAVANLKKRRGAKTSDPVS